MRALLTALTTVGLMAFAAETPTPPGTETSAADQPGSLITRPDWAGRPSGEDLARYYPERAQRLEVEGRAVILCAVKDDGFLSDCEVTDESPEGMGFGAATLKLAPHFRMKPATIDGQPVHGASVRIPVNYKLPDSSAPEPTAGNASASRGFAYHRPLPRSAMP